MPAQSGDDPLSVALHLTLAPSKYRTKMGEITSPSSPNNLGIDSRISSTASEILSTSIKYTDGDKSYSSTSLFTKLKEKYTVLSTNGSQQLVSSGSSSSVNSEELSSSQKTISSGSSSPNNLEKKKTQQQIISSSPVSQQVPSKNSTTVTTASLPLPKKILYPPNLVCLGWKGSVPVGAGFVNLGNTCYLNSALQALLHVPAFVNWLQSDTIHISQCESMNGMTHSECLICAMVKILHNTHKYTGSAIKPVHIYSKLKDICKHLVHGHQEDAHEFLRYLIEGMERSYLNIFNGMRLDSYSKETTPLNQIFGGYMRTEVSCLECGYISTTFQHFQDLLLDIRQANSVEEALETYFSRERLGDGDQAYKCSQCKRRAAATKKFSVERPPNALCIQLKRFNAMGGKNNRHISIKQVLDMTRFIHPSHCPAGSLKYKLVSMVVHLGQSANCGHYTAIGQSAAGSYYHFDDSIVRPVPLQNVLNTNAYIILYERKVSMEPLREKIVEQTSVETNGIKTTDSNNISLSSMSQPSSVDKIVNDDKQISPRIPKLQSPMERSPKVITENCIPPSPKKDTKNISPKENTNSSSVSTTSEVTNNVECSLVPYLSESSESESGCETSQSTLPFSVYDFLNKIKNGNRGKEEEKNKTTKDNSSVKTESGEQQKVGGGTSSTGWQVTSVKHNVVNSNETTSSASGKWSVVRTEERESVTKEGNDGGVSNHTNVREFGGVNNKKEPNRNSSSPSSNNNSTQNTVQSLLEMSHQGYGNSNINSWNGNRSKLSKDIERDRQQTKRPFSSYNDDMDRGKIKKKRYHKGGNIENDGSSSWNRMQDFQNRKNCWNSSLGARQNFYRQYSYEKSKGHSHHHPHYRGIGGGNYYNRGNGGGNGFPLSTMSSSLLYKKPHCT